MKLERMCVALPEFKVLGSADEGIAEMYVAAFNNVDFGNDRFRMGAFQKSIERKPPKGVWSHDWSTPVAKTLESREVPPNDPSLPDRLRELGGVYVKAAFNLDTQRGREAFSDLKFGTIDEFSIGFIAQQEAIDNQTGVREILQVDWIEWSPVLAGMNGETQLISTKSLDQDDPEGRYPRAGMRLSDQAEALLDDADRAITRFKILYGPDGMRTKEGRTLSGANRDKVQAIHDRMQQVSDHATAAMAHCKELLQSTQKGQDGPTQEQMQAAFVDFMRIQHNLQQAGIQSH